MPVADKRLSASLQPSTKSRLASTVIARQTNESFVANKEKEPSKRQKKSKKLRMRRTRPCLTRSTGTRSVSSVARKGRSSAKRDRRTGAGSNGKSMKSASSARSSWANTNIAQFLHSTREPQETHAAHLNAVKSVWSPPSVKRQVRLAKKPGLRTRMPTRPRKMTTSAHLSVAETWRLKLRTKKF